MRKTPLSNDADFKLFKKAVEYNFDIIPHRPNQFPCVAVEAVEYIYYDSGLEIVRYNVEYVYKTDFE